MKGTGAKRSVCPGSCVTTGAKFPVAPVESAPMCACDINDYVSDVSYMNFPGPRITACVYMSVHHCA